MSYFISALLSPFLVAGYLANLVWTGVCAGWMAGERMMDGHFGGLK